MADGCPGFGGTDDVSSSPVVEWYAVVGRRWMRPQRIWSMNLDLATHVKDWTTDEQYLHLMDMAIRQEAVLFQHKDEQHMVELTLARGPQLTGKDERSMVSITLLESNDLDWVRDETQFSNAVVT